jgi:hypothetical protein
VDKAMKNGYLVRMFGPQVWDFIQKANEAAKKKS